LRGLQAHLQQGDRLLGRVAGKRVGQLIRVQLSEDTKNLLDRVSKASSRPSIAIVTAAARDYLEDPDYYKPRLKVQDLPFVISVRVSRGISDFFLDEAFVAPIRGRGSLLGLIVGIFLRRYPFRDLATALHAFADVLGPMLRERTHGRPERRNQAPEDPEDYPTRRPGLR
jgi:hypothetical protein